MKVGPGAAAAAAASMLLAFGASSSMAKEATQGATASSLEARLQRLEDTESIRLLLERYIELNESRDYPAYSRLFAKDGELVLRRGRATGPEAILKLMQDSFGAANASASNPLNGSLHVLSNVKINVTGDTATATSRWTLLLRGEDGPKPAQAGHYGDKLVRENGEWKFQQRIIYRDIPVDPQTAR
jgi:ketosteroid isomerase-like protein